MGEQADIYERITARIIEQMEVEKEQRVGLLRGVSAGSPHLLNRVQDPNLREGRATPQGWRGTSSLERLKPRRFR